jgi:hypothetical protein
MTVAGALLRCPGEMSLSCEIGYAAALLKS